MINLKAIGRERRKIRSLQYMFCNMEPRICVVFKSNVMRNVLKHTRGGPLYCRTVGEMYIFVRYDEFVRFQPSQA